MPSAKPPAAAIKPLLEECGYAGARLAEDYKVGDRAYPFVGFATKPWDFDSACIAVVEANGEPRDAAKACRELGAPIVWVTHNGTVDWWIQHGTAPTRFDSKPIDQFRKLVRQKKANLDPRSVYRAKTLGRLAKAQQLDFVDVGLMPLLREEAGRKLGGLVEEMTRVTLKGLGERNPSGSTLRDVFARVFRLLAGKILMDKGVGHFGSLDLADPSAVLTAVGKHYNAAQPGIRLTREWKDALKDAASLVARFGNVRVISPETLAYVYEHTLVSKALRKKLGIHATPPWLVDYIVWQSYDWIREIPVAERHVFEPACGHAPFLLAAMRLLRLEMQEESPAQTHSYLQRHIHGVELDDFALEIARLSLTLADIPNPNGWDLRPDDMYATNVLVQEKHKHRILFCNPPYEPFTDIERRKYKAAGHPVHHKKAVELLRRVLPGLPIGSVFGVVVPQAVLTGAEATDVRRTLLRNFELAEICRFPGNVFEFAEMETAIILGRRLSGTPDPAHRVRLRFVPEHGLPSFIDRYHADEIPSVSQTRFARNADSDFTVPALDELWQYLSQCPKLSGLCEVGRGIEYKSKAARLGRTVVSDAPRRGFSPGYAGVETEQDIFSLPRKRWLALRPDLIANSRTGLPTGKPRILVNRVRTARGPWRLKALLDSEGLTAKDNFRTVSPISRDTAPEYIWALLNSPLANAFIGRETMQRDNKHSDLADLPVPRTNSRGIEEVVIAARTYRAFAKHRAAVQELKDKQRTSNAPLFAQLTAAPESPTEAQAQDALLAMDAAVLKLYGLPARLERQLLDHFRGHVRNGVGCVFGDYFPADFESLVPLHKFISSDYQQSTINEVAARMKPGESATVLAALRNASEALGEGQ